MASTEHSFFSTSDWTDKVGYAYSDQLTNEATAWEYLRRNRDYRTAWDRARLSEHQGRVRQNRVEIGESSEAAQLWGVLAWEDPWRDARTAHVLWSPCSSSVVLPVYAIDRTRADHLPRLDLSRFACEIVVLRENGAPRHLLFLDQGRRLQLALEEGDIATAAQLLTGVPVGPHLLRRHFTLVRRLSGLAERGCLDAQLYQPDPPRYRRALLLQALDGALAGASHRDIAVALFGRERVRADWNDPGENMRDRVRRAIRRARWLMRGGYRHLLR